MTPPGRIALNARRTCDCRECASSRCRRWSIDAARREYYRHSREIRFARHFGAVP